MAANAPDGAVPAQHRNPVEDLQALATLAEVVAQGRLYTREMLDAAVARHQRYFTGHLYEAVTLRLMRMLMRHF